MDKAREKELTDKCSKAFNQRVEVTDALHVKFLEHPNFLEYDTDDLKHFVDHVVFYAELLVEAERNFRTTICLAGDEIRKTMEEK